MSILLQGIFLSLAATVTWTIAPVLYRKGLDVLSYTGLGAVRCIGYIISAAAYLLYTMGSAGFALPPAHLLLKIAISGVIWLVVGDLCYFAALKNLGVSVCVPIVSTIPIAIVVSSWVFLGESAAISKLFAACITVTGVIFLTSGAEKKDEKNESSKNIKKGVIMALVTISCWCTGIITSVSMVNDVPLPVMEWWRAVSVSVGSWLVFMASDRKWLKKVKGLGAAKIAEVALAGALGLTVGNLFYMNSVKFIPISLTSCIQGTRPFIAASFGVIFLKEKFNKKMLLGVTLVVTGIITMALV